MVAPQCFFDIFGHNFFLKEIFFPGTDATVAFIPLIFCSVNYLFLPRTDTTVSIVNVILTRQTCGQRSSMSAGSKRRALAFNCSICIWYMFPISECRGDLDLGVCTSLVLAKRMLLRGGDFRLKNVFGRKI